MWETIQTKVYNFTGNGDIAKPMMVFSVIGDGNSFVSRPWQTIGFQNALIEAAKNGGGKVLFLEIINVDYVALKHYCFYRHNKPSVMHKLYLINMRNYHVQNNMLCKYNAD